MNLKTFTLTLASTRPIRGSASLLRGFFATKFNEYSLLHQHSADKFIYSYPLDIYEIVEKGISVRDQEFGLSDKIHAYEFATPWLALNQENYMKYYALPGREERQEFLRKTLIGNLLSMSKSLDYRVIDKIKCGVDVKARKNGSEMNFNNEL